MTLRDLYSDLFDTVIKNSQNNIIFDADESICTISFSDKVLDYDGCVKIKILNANNRGYIDIYNLIRSENETLFYGNLCDQLMIDIINLLKENINVYY